MISSLKRLRHFLAVAEEGSFHAAAERLHMAQPPLTVSVRKLEAEVGALLFERLPTGVRLTAIGTAVLVEAERAVFHAQQCQQLVQAVAHGEAGLLRISFVSTAMFDLLPKMITSFRRKHPGIELKLIEGTTTGILSSLQDRRIDLGFVRVPLFDKRPFSLNILDNDSFVIAVPADSELAGFRSIPLARLADEPFVMYDQALVPGLFSVAMLRCQQSGFVPKIAQEAGQVLTVLSLVQSGLGVGLVPGVAAKYLPRRVRLVPLSDTPASFRVGIAVATLLGTVERNVEVFRDHCTSAVGRSS